MYVHLCYGPDKQDVGQQVVVSVLQLQGLQVDPELVLL